MHLRHAFPALVVALAACTPRVGPNAPSSELARLDARAARVTITRDDWGIAHVHGPTDADAVFGMIYAQAEDDFNRVEMNFVDAMGRRAEAEGERAVYLDLRMKLFIDPDSLKSMYATSPEWLKSLMNAWADGLNYYLATHPQVKPRVITRFEPWMALSFSEGSIGGDIESIDLRELGAFYGKRTVGMYDARNGMMRDARHSMMHDARRGVMHVEDRGSGSLADRGSSISVKPFVEPSGSNGFAIAPSNTAGHHALLLINPHTSFFFRSELQMTSDEGLNAYGAATWGQFFIYQGFNDRLGWMHTSSSVDVIDEFAETIVDRGGKLFYRYGSEERPVRVDTIAVPYRDASGAMGTRRFTVYRTHHGPIVREEGGKWISVALMNTPVAALEQSYLRTKARDYRSYLEVADRYKANSSNNTIFASADGDIAYLHPQFIPRRDDRFDYTKPVDGSDPATDWRGLTPLDSAPHVLNPPNGWIFNTNDWPYSAAGPYSPKRESFPRYMDTAGENPRGVHATMVLEGKKDFTLSSLRDAAFDSYLTAFAKLIPTLVAAWDSTPAGDPLRARVPEQIAVLRGWDYRWSVSSVPTSLAVFWGERAWGAARAEERDELMSTYDFIATRMSGREKLQALADASDRLTADFGSWRTPWGEINRFQRLTGDIVQPFTDAGPSIPVGFTSSQWGSLASFGARRYPGTKRYYGTSGNSFVAMVEFGDSVKALAVTAGGESGHPDSRHFDDQAERYATGNLRDVYFYSSQLVGHTERTYSPGR